jgi:hypothetical protein
VGRKNSQTWRRKVNKANHIEPCKDDSLVSNRPLFSSAWLALYTVLRSNYSKRHLAGTTKTENLQAENRKQKGLH